MRTENRRDWYGWNPLNLNGVPCGDEKGSLRSMDYLWISMDYPFIINWYPWIIHWLSMDYPCKSHWQSMVNPLIICGLSMDNPWIIHDPLITHWSPWESIDYHWIINGSPMDNPCIIHGSSMDYLWIIHGLSMDSQWTSLGFHELPGAGWTGRPCWGNRQAHSGGTARAGNINAFLIQKVRTLSSKPGWGKMWGVVMNSCVLKASVPRGAPLDPLTP